MITPLDLPLSEVMSLDGELVRLVRARHRERLSLGRELAALGLRYRELGFRTLGAYVRERASQSARWCGDAKTLASRLEERPALREAFLRCEINWSQAELMARGSTPDDEAELLEACRGMSVRALRDAMRTDASEAAQPEEEEPRVTLDLPAASMVEGLTLELTRMGIEHMNGGDREGWFDCLIAEGISSLPEVLEAEESVDPGPMLEERRQLRRSRAERIAEWEALCTPTATPVEVERFAEALEDLTELSPNALDARIVGRSARIASGDVWLGKLLDRFFRTRGWDQLGYMSEQHYCDQRLGISRSTARARVTLTRKLRWLDGLDVAIQEGELGYEHAALVSRVATPDTLEAWIARAKVRTFKHLREEVRAAELVSSLHGEARVTAPPPDGEELEVVLDLERQVLSGRVLLDAVDEPPVQMSVNSRPAHLPAADLPASSSPAYHSPPSKPAEPATEDDQVASPPPVQMSVGFGRRPRTRVRVDESTALVYRQIEALWKHRGLPGTFWGFCVLVYWRAWGPRFRMGTSAKAVFDRDRHRCACPVCDSRNCTNHHVRYRAHGGGDELDNQITACEFCHLEGEHGGRLKVRGRASGLVWLLGRVPVMRVEGRTKMAA